MHPASLELPQATPHFNFATDVMDRWAQLRPDAVALWTFAPSTAQEQKITFRQICELSTRAANFFATCGIAKGDRVLVMLPRIPQWWISMLGLIRLGAMPVPATLLLTERDVAYRLETARARAVITEAEGARKIGGFEDVRIFVGATGSTASVPSAGWFDFNKGIRQADVRARNEKTCSDDPGMLFFTSATTGEPKMVLHTQASYGLGHRVTGQYWLDLKPGDVHWNISDLGWGKAAWSSLFGPWHMGACIFALDTHGKFDPVLTLETLATFPINTWCAPATALSTLFHKYTNV
jgi:acetyl-CoA synthetase/medium-chain acyl-CoA synthetase